MVAVFVGSSLCPVPVSTGHVAMRTRVRILTGSVITYHWTEAQPVFVEVVNDFFYNKMIKISKVLLAGVGQHRLMSHGPTCLGKW